jgi:taurine dioxygenase
VKIDNLEGVGVEISDIDISKLGEADFAVVQMAFSEHGVVFFRDQEITEAQHIEFAQRWGNININRFFEANSQFPQIAIVRKEADQQVNIGGSWHTDHSYDVEPALGSILVARELPAKGGDTWFTSMYKAYDALSPGLQATLAGLKAVHSAQHVFGSKGAHIQAADTRDRIGNTDAADALQEPAHPVVITHPLSGKKALYVNPGFTRHFEGWTAEESAPLLNYLYEVAQNKAFLTRFKWRPGSIAFWDNRATWHMAQNDYQGHRRIMHRITIAGTPLKPCHPDKEFE